jgi:hypothetical protein
MKPQKNDKHIMEVLNDSEGMRQIIQIGIRKALLQHKQAGNPVCGWKDGKVFWIEAKDIPV